MADRGGKKGPPSGPAIITLYAPVGATNRWTRDVEPRERAIGLAERRIVETTSMVVEAGIRTHLGQQTRTRKSPASTNPHPPMCSCDCAPSDDDLNSCGG
jgi:hypothetical protein